MGVGGEEGSLAANGREDLVSKGLTHSQWEPGGADPAHSIQESQVFKMDGRECGRRKGARGEERAGQRRGRRGRPASGLGPGGGRRGGRGGPEPEPGEGQAGCGRACERGSEAGERGRGGKPRGREGQRKSPGRRRWQAEERNEERCVGIGSSQKGNAGGSRFYSLSGGEGLVWALSLVFSSPPLRSPTRGHLFGVSFRNHGDWGALGMSRRGGFPVIFQRGVWWGRGGGPGGQG